MMSQVFGIWSSDQSAFSNGSCGFESEIVTPDGAYSRPVLLNDGLQVCRVRGRACFCPASATFLNLMGWLFLSNEGPLPATFSYRVREWGIRRPCIDLGHDIGSVGAREGQRFRFVVRCRDQALERIGMVFRRDPPLLRRMDSL